MTPVQKIERLREALRPFLAGSKADPNAKKGWATAGKWTTVNVRTEDYEAARAALSETEGE